MPCQTQVIVQKTQETRKNACFMEVWLVLCLISLAAQENFPTLRQVTKHQFITDLAKAKVPIQVASKLARHSKLELTAKVYTHLSAEDTAAEVEKLATIRDVPKSGIEVLSVDDFGPAHGPARFAKQANFSDDLATRSTDSKNEESPQKQLFPGLSSSDADETRTRNHRIDSPEL